MRRSSLNLFVRAGALAVAMLLLGVSGARAADDRSTPNGVARVRILWRSVGLEPQCHVSVQTVEEEVRRIFGAMGIEIDWQAPHGATAVSDDEVSVIALLADPRRPETMGATVRGSLTAWVYCTTTARALHVDASKPASALSLGRALGKVVAHEVVHMLTPDQPHMPQGLMAGSWRQELSDPRLSPDALTRLAVLERLTPEPKPQGVPSHGSSVSYGDR